MLTQEYTFYGRKFTDPRSGQINDLASTVIHLRNTGIPPLTWMASAIEMMTGMDKQINPDTGMPTYYINPDALKYKYAYDASPYSRMIRDAAMVTDLFQTAMFSERARKGGRAESFERAPALLRNLAAVTGIKFKQDIPERVAQERYTEQTKRIMKMWTDRRGITMWGRTPTDRTMERY